MNRTVVFILSNGHSGSTMLDMILGSNKSCVSLGEFRVVDSKHISEEKRRRIGYRYCAICKDNCPVWSELLPKMVWPRFHNAAFDHFDVPVLIDSSKIVGWASLCEENISADIKYIRLTRSAYDRFGSFRQKRGKVTAYEVKNWVKHEEEITNFLVGKSHIKVKYEDLCKKRGLEALCEYVGIDYDPKMWDFWKTHHHNLRGNVKTATLVKKHHGIIGLKDLNPTQIKFMKRVGFNVKYIDKRKHLLPEDIALIKNTGAAKINKKLGYK